MRSCAAKERTPTATATAQATASRGQAPKEKGSDTANPPTQNAKKIVGALSVARMARMLVTAPAPRTAEAIPASSPTENPGAPDPGPTTRNTPAVTTASASPRCTVGRSPSVKNDRT